MAAEGDGPTTVTRAAAVRAAGVTTNLQVSAISRTRPDIFVLADSPALSNITLLAHGPRLRSRSRNRAPEPTGQALPRKAGADGGQTDLVPGCHAVHTGHQPCAAALAATKPEIA